MQIKEIHSKSILSTSQIYDYVVNPYVGCQHACSYCYARFMKRFTGHQEAWGEFVDVKINGADLLIKEIKKKKPGTVWLSGVCDPYQPLEAKYRLSRRCLDILAQNDWPVAIQTRSPLILRDMDICKKSGQLEAGLTITTADEAIRKIFEPRAPSIMSRLKAVESLHQNGIRTYVMIAPLLPGAENLVELLAGKVGYILVDRMNYSHADKVYKMHGMTEKNSDEYFNNIGSRIVNACARMGVECRKVY